MSNISRRTVAKGAAWSVPVIAVGAAAPAYAVSGGIFQLNGNGCKLPGNSNSTFKGYAFKLSAVNNTNADITITIDAIDLNGDDLGMVVFVDFDGAGNCEVIGTDTLTIPANTSLNNLAVLTENAASSANGTLTVTYTILGGATVTVTAAVDAAPPINGASCNVFTEAQKDCLATV